MNSRSATATPGAQRHRDAVAGGEQRVGRDREALARAAGGDHGVPRVDGLRARCPTVARDRRRGAAVVAREVDGEPAFVHLGTRLLDRGDQRALDLGAGGVAARVHDPGDGVAALTGEGEPAVAGDRSNRAPRAISSRTRPGPRSPARRTASASQSPPPAVRVSEPCSAGGVVFLDQRGGDAALRVPGGRPADLALGEHADREAGVPGVDRRGQARDTAAEDEEIGHGRVRLGRA